MFKLLDERAGNPVFNDNMHAANTKVGAGNRTDKHAIQLTTITSKIVLTHIHNCRWW